MTSLPDYLTDQTEEAIMLRMLEKIPSDMDKNEGSYIWDALSPTALELAQAAIWAQEVLRRGFAATTYGNYLDLRCEEHGLTRRSAVKAAGAVTFSGLNGTIIPAGTHIATPADSGSPSREFTTQAQAVIGASGNVTVNTEALEPGAAGNVAAGTITILLDTISGISGVTNNTPASGGQDTENDESLLARYLQKVRTPSAGGNKADYINWALEVSGVGGVSVIPIRDGAGTVSVAIIDSDGQPAGQALVDAVQNYIAPPWNLEIEAEDMTLGGSGSSLDDTLEDDSGTSVKMIYDAAGEGTLTGTALQNTLTKAGLWQIRTRVKVDNTASGADLLTVGIWNISTGSWAKTTVSSSEEAMITFNASDLSIAFQYYSQDFYWNGTDQLELRIARKQADTTTAVWIDSAIYRSTFSKDTGDGKAPIGARLTVEAAAPVSINISTTLVITTGYNAQNVINEVEQNIDTYLKSLSFTEDNDVRYVRIGQVILDTPGVQDYSNLLVNNGTSNIPIGLQEVAVKGTVTFS